MKTNPVLWITVQECEAIFGKSRGSVQNAIDKLKIKARQSVVGYTWLLEYYSCLEFWGVPANPSLVGEILKDVK